MEGMEVTDTADLVDKARAALSTAEIRLLTFERHRDAKKAAELITANQAIIDLLDETGLRLVKLSQSLESFRASYTDPLCGQMGIPPMTLGTDMGVTLGRYPWQMLSASEQYSRQIVLQLAVAQIEKAGLVIIDGADIIEPALRGKLLQTVRSVEIPAIICMTLSNPDKAPDLSAANAGATYWIADGTCTAFKTSSSIGPAVSVETEPSGFFEGMKKKAGVAA